MLFVGSKYYDGSTTIRPDKVDLYFGKDEIDKEEMEYLEEQRLRGPRSRWRRIWDAL
jgi:yeast amino acid transporter